MPMVGVRAARRPQRTATNTAATAFVFTMFPDKGEKATPIKDFLRGDFFKKHAGEDAKKKIPADIAAQSLQLPGEEKGSEPVASIQTWKDLQPDDELMEKAKTQPDEVDKEWERVAWCEGKLKELQCAKHEASVDFLHKDLVAESPGYDEGLWSGVNLEKLGELSVGLKDEKPYVKLCAPFKVCTSEAMKKKIPPKHSDEPPDDFFWERDPNLVGKPADSGVVVKGRIDFKTNEVIAALGKTKLPQAGEDAEVEKPYVVNKEPGHWIVDLHKRKKPKGFDWGIFDSHWE